MKTAFLKAVVGVIVAVTACAAALFVPGLLRDDAATQLSTQSLVPTASQPSVPTTAPIAPPAATSAVAIATATPEPPDPTPTPGLAPAVRPTALPTAIVIEALVGPAPSTDAPSDPTPAARAALAAADSVPASLPTAEPTVGAQHAQLEVAPTAIPSPTAEPTSAPTATQKAEPTPTAEPTVEPTPAPTAEPTAEPTPEPTAEPTATPQPTKAPEPDLQPDGSDTTVVGAGWMFVDSETGLFVRDEPAGNIVNVIEHRGQVYVSGRVVALQGRLWMYVESPAPGWVALSFLTTDQPPAPVEPTPSVPSEPPTAEDWAAFRSCEAGGRYDAVDISGLYHGAYQFLPSTWDGLARRFWPELVGVLPSQASPQDQDKLAAMLFELEGARPWPVCGRHLL